MGAHDRQRRVELARRRALKPRRARPRRASRRTGRRCGGTAPRDRGRGRGRAIRRARAPARRARPGRRRAAVRSRRTLRGRADVRCRSDGPEPRGGLRVGRGELGVQVGGRPALRRGADLGPDRLGNGRHVRKTLGQGAEIKARAAGENDRTVANSGQNFARPPQPTGRRRIDRAVDFAEEPVRRLPFLIGRRTRGEDAEVGIDLHRIGVDDGRAEFVGQSQRRRGLAARRRSCEEERSPHAVEPLSPPGLRMPASVLVATLIADPERAPLTDARIDRAALALGGIERRRWLDEGVAADLVVDRRPRRQARRARGAFRRRTGRRRSSSRSRDARRALLVADMDFDPDRPGMRRRARRAGRPRRPCRGDHRAGDARRDRVRAGAARARRAARGSAGRGDRRRAGEPGSRSTPARARSPAPCAPAARKVVIVSGGFRQFTSAVAALIGADEDRANTLETGGREASPARSSSRSSAATPSARRCSRSPPPCGLALEATLAVGDGANDLAMLGRGGLGVAYRAKPQVAAAADARIDHADLTALLYAQGIPRKRFRRGLNALKRLGRSLAKRPRTLALAAAALALAAVAAYAVVERSRGLWQVVGACVDRSEVDRPAVSLPRRRSVGRQERGHVIFRPPLGERPDLVADAENRRRRGPVPAIARGAELFRPGLGGARSMIATPNGGPPARDRNSLIVNSRHRADAGPASHPYRLPRIPRRVVCWHRLRRGSGRRVAADRPRSFRISRSGCCGWAERILRAPIRSVWRSRPSTPSSAIGRN